MGFLKYITLGFALFNAATTIIAMVRVPALLSAIGAWEVIQPALSEIQAVAGIKINMALALQITTDAVNTVKSALTKGAISGPLQTGIPS